MTGIPEDWPRFTVVRGLRGFVIVQRFDGSVDMTMLSYVGASSPDDLADLVRGWAAKQDGPKPQAEAPAPPAPPPAAPPAPEHPPAADPAEASARKPHWTQRLTPEQRRAHAAKMVAAKQAPKPNGNGGHAAAPEPPPPPDPDEEAKDLLRGGMSARQLAEELRIPLSRASALALAVRQEAQQAR